MVLVEGQSPINYPTNPLSDRETATCIGWFGGRSFSSIESIHFTKLGRVTGEGFLPWVARRLRKETVVDGGA